MGRRLLGLLLVLTLGLVGVTFAQPEPESVFFDLINGYRAQMPFCFSGEAARGWGDAPRTLARSHTLDIAARSHTQAMFRANCPFHQCPGEADPVQRVLQTGHQGWGWLAENIAWDSPTAEAAMSVWVNSPPHDRVMLACEARSIGIAEFNGWWTTVFTDSTVPDAPPALRAPSDGGTCFKLDLNGNNMVDDGEINEVMRLWILGEPLCD